jgi:RNA polymerase sigma factor (sigma-70 family)
MPTRTTVPSDRRLPPFERVLEEHGRAVLRFCVAEVGSERADDCFQETMLAALAAYPELRDPGAVRGWLIAIAARKAIDLHRASVRAADAVEDIDSVARSEASDTARADDAGLWARIARLPDKQRRALTLRYAADLSHREIASVMQTSEAAARRNVFEALARLRVELGADAALAESHEGASPRVSPTWRTRSRSRSQSSKRG